MKLNVTKNKPLIIGGKYSFYSYSEAYIIEEAIKKIQSNTKVEVIDTGYYIEGFSKYRLHYYCILIYTGKRPDNKFIIDGIHKIEEENNKRFNKYEDVGACLDLY